MEVTAIKDGILAPDIARQAFEASPLVTPAPPRPYDEDREGRSLTVLSGEGRVGPSPPSELRAVLNWFQELTTRVPVP